MNGVALKFIPKAEMEEKGYGDFLPKSKFARRVGVIVFSPSSC